MPLPLTILPVNSTPKTNNLANTVEKVLVEANVIPANTTAADILNSCGATLEQSIVGLANLSLTARDAVKYNAIKDILDIHGVKFRKDTENTAAPVIQFNISAENVQANLNDMFAPSRD